MCHLCPDVHLQGRGEGRKEQLPALLPSAALPCMTLLTSLVLCQSFPWSFGAHCASNATLTRLLLSVGLLPACSVGPGLCKLK